MRNALRPLRALLPLVAALLMASLAPAHTGAAPAGAPAPAQPLPTDRLIIQLAPSAGAQIAASPDRVAAALSDEAGAELGYVRPLGEGAHVLSLPAARPYAEVAAVARQLAATPEVLTATPDAILLPARTPTDPDYDVFSWHLEPSGAGSYGVNLPAAWDITTGSPSIVTAIIDTGGLLGHEDLAGRTIPGNPGYDMLGDPSISRDGDGRDPDPSDPGDYVTQAEAVSGCGARNSSWHGSHVGGTIGASANNGKGTAGATWESPLLFMRVLGKCGGYLSDISDGMRWAAGLPVAGLPTNPNPARVLNLSIGGASDTCSSVFQQTINAVTAAGTVVVVAAGNDGGSAALSQPGSCAGVITVAATARNGNRAWYSNYGPAVELAAPGGDINVDSAIYSTVSSGAQGPVADSYGSYQGTSMAAPHVSGIVSLMLSANPGLTPATVQQILLATAAPFPPGSSCAGGCGAGIVDAGAAVEEAARLVRTATFQSAGSTVTEGELTVRIPVSLSIASNQVVGVPFTVLGSAGAGDHNLAAGVVTFAPGATSASLSFTVTDDALTEDSETIVVTLGSGSRSGRGALPTHTVTVEDNDLYPSIALTPASLDVGEQPVGTTGATGVVTISNPGGVPLTVRGVAITGDFQRDGGSCATSYPLTLAAGASCTVRAKFTPTRVGSRAGGLLVTSNAPDSPQTVPLYGTGTIPALGFAPTGLRFAGQLAGAAGPSQTITLTNPGTAPARISALEASGDFRVVGTTCALASPATLAPGASCAVSVGFTPQAGGAREGSLTVTSDVPGGPYSAQLSGEGLAPALSLDVAGLNFGGQQAGLSATPRTVTLANAGGADLTISTISVSGAAFARSGGSCPALPATLAPGASCTVVVGFTPALAEAYSGSLSVTSDDPGDPVVVPLAGVGTSAPAASPLLTPGSLSFASQMLPALAATRTVTLTNVGDATVRASAITVSGAGFALSGGSCGALPRALAPGEGCTIGVSFTAPATGAASGTLSVTSDAPGGPQVVPLAGQGTAGAGSYAIESLTAGGGADALTVSFRLSRAAPSAGAASVGYSLVGTREVAGADLPVAAGRVAFGPGQTSASASVTLDRLGLYGVTELVLSLDEPVDGVSPAGLRAVAVPPAWRAVYMPLSWR